MSFNYRHPMGMKWYLTEVLIFIFLMASDVENPFMCSLYTLNMCSHSEIVTYLFGELRLSMANIYFMLSFG